MGLERNELFQFKSTIIICGAHLTEVATHCQRNHDEIRSNAKTLFDDEYCLHQYKQQIPDLNVYTVNNPDHPITFVDTHLLWVIGSLADPLFNQIREKASNNDQFYCCISIGIGPNQKMPPISPKETCICINDPLILDNFIHDMTALWVLPNLIGIDLSDFYHVVSGKQCGIEALSIQNIEEIKKRTDSIADVFWHQISKASSIFNLFVFDRSSYHQIVDAIILAGEVINSDNLLGDNGPEILMADIGWPGYLNMDCSIRLTAIYNIEQI